LLFVRLVESERGAAYLRLELAELDAVLGAGSDAIWVFNKRVQIQEPGNAGIYQTGQFHALYVYRDVVENPSEISVFGVYFQSFDR